MEEYREQFEKEKGRTYWAEGCDYGSFNDEYVNWLEQQLKILNIPVVMQRSELLTDFMEMIEEGGVIKFDKPKLLHDFKIRQ